MAGGSVDEMHGADRIEARKVLSDGQSLVVRAGRGGVSLDVEGGADRWDFGDVAEAIAALGLFDPRDDRAPYLRANPVPGLQAAGTP